MIEFILSFITAYSTLKLHGSNRASSVFASSLVTIISFLVLLVINLVVDFDINHFMFFIFGASFVGMCSKEKGNFYQLLLYSFLYTVFLFNFSKYLTGIGGALGLSAFLSVYLGYHFTELISKIASTPKWSERK